MALDPKLIDHLAQLARIALDADEKTQLGADLARTLAMMDALQRIELTAGEPLQPAPAPLDLRADVVTEPDASAELLALAPMSHGGYYLVPRVLG